MCMYDDCDDFPGFYAVRERKARKPHKCTECGREIARGEIYQHVAGQWDGRVDVIKTCSHCMVVQKWLQKECGGFVHYAVLDDLSEHIAEYGVREYGFGVARLVVLGRNDWRRRGVLVPIPAVPPTTHDKDQP